jgi:hypothetical protein
MLQALLKEVDQVRHAPQDDKLLQRVSALSSQDSGPLASLATTSTMPAGVHQLSYTC